MIKDNILDFNKEDIEEQLEELNKILNSKSKNIKFLVMYKDLREIIGVFHIDIKVEIPSYWFEQVIHFECKNYLTVEYIIESLKYHILEKLCKKVGLENL
ncbi:MAG: hypothetical protein IKL65_00515 [Bacilli bacterium]|nr:hypothetical protein [Bacilli bacterium]MBR6689799.1 hypothetical protein [Bacilli bacterium]